MQLLKEAKNKKEKEKIYIFCTLSNETTLSACDRTPFLIPTQKFVFVFLQETWNVNIGTQALCM